MTSWGVDLVAVATAALVFWGRPKAALATLLGVAVLVPTPLVVPHMHTALFTLQRLLVIVVAARLVRMSVDGRRSVVRPRDPAFIALMAVIVVSFTVGMVVGIDSSYSVDAAYSLANLLTQVGFFLACLVFVRELESPWGALAIAAGVMFVDAGIGIAEHVTGNAWGHWWMGHLQGQTNTDAAHPLSLRNGETRVKAGSEFALQFSWITLMLLPCCLAFVTRVKSGLYLGIAAVATAGLAIYWSYSRSTLGGLLPAIILLALLVRRKAMSSMALAGVVGGLIAYGLVPSLSQHLEAGSEDVSVVTRFHKLVPIFGEVARHPFRGLGLGNLTASGYHTTDNALLLVYIELGILGVAALLLLLLTVAGQALRAYAVALPDDRPAAAACLVSVLAYIASTQIYDAFTLLQGPQVLWFLLAVSTVIAERSGRPVRVRRLPWPQVAAIGVGGMAIGWALVAVAPIHVGYRTLLTTQPAFSDALPYDTSNSGKFLITTACTEADQVAGQLPGVSVDCRSVSQVGGVGMLYLQAPTRTQVEAAKEQIVATIRGPGGVAGLQLFDEDPPHAGSPTLMKTAPAWLPLLLLGLALLPPLPPLRARPRALTRARLEAGFAG